MNSHQRRFIRRYWKHYIVIDFSESEYLEARVWCKKQFGKIGYRWGNYKWEQEFCFKNQKDYVAFLLKWS